MDLIPGLRLDRFAAAPLSEQLSDQLRTAIVAGELLPGDRLPATRSLAESLGVSRTVIVGAYDRLLGEAFLESTPGSGTRVAPELQGWDSASQHNPAPQGDPKRIPPLAEQRIQLTTGRPHVAPDPPRDWSRSLARAARRAWSPEGPPPRGDPELRRQLAAHLRLYRGVVCASDDLLITSGTAESLLLVGLALRSVHNGERPRVAVEDPGYAEGVAALQAAGASCVPIGVTENGIDLAGFRALHARESLDAVMLTPSHQFPMGGRLPAEDRRLILEWAHQNNAFVIEDDYDSEFRHTGAVLPAVAALDRSGASIYIASLNKILSPSLRCGMLVLPSGDSAMRPALLRAREVAGASVSAHTQSALAEFVADGGLKRAIARNKREYRHRRELVLAGFAEQGIPVVGADGGLHVVVELPDRIDAGETARELAQRGVLVETLADLATGDSGRNGLALGYGAESIPRLVSGIGIVAGLLAERGGADS